LRRGGVRCPLPLRAFSASAQSSQEQVPLDYYAIRSWVEERQYQAGTEFHKLLGEWASYLGPEELEGHKIKRRSEDGTLGSAL
jgi:hypothetical protein